MNEDLLQVNIMVTGKVQRVGFRFFTIECANNTDLVGWVRNRKNNTVEILAEGSQIAIDQFIEKIKIGPSMGRVDNIEVEYLPYSGNFTKFKSRLTK
jgi:acylphosphatase